MRTYVSKNRLESVISKIGALDINNPLRVSEIKSEFSQDILTDFNENNGNLLEELSQEDKEWITERLNSEIQRIIFIAAKEK